MTDCCSALSTEMDYGLDIFAYLDFIYDQLKRGEKDYKKLCPWNEEIIKKFGSKNKDLKI